MTAAARRGPALPCPGLRILEVAQGIAGPYAGALFAGLGADVLKVEPPGGDVSRRLGPFPGDQPHLDRSGAFIALNGGKRSVVLDPDRGADRERLRRLALAADVVLHDAAPERARALKLDADELLAERPDLVIVAVTPFGQDGPYSGFRGDEILYQALSGCADITGEPSREPLVIGVPLAQVAAGENAFVAATAGLLGRLAAGRFADVSIFESMCSIMEHSPFIWAYRGKVWKRRGNWTGVAGWGIYPCHDGYVGVVSGIADSWPRFADMVGLDRPELLRPSARTLHADEVHAAVFRWLEGKGKEEACLIAQEEYSLPFGYLSGPREILASPHLRRRRFLRAVAQPGVGRLLVPGPPFRLGGYGWRQAPAPALGPRRRGLPGWRRRRTAAAGGRASLPLEGVRVLDFSQVWAGPHCAKVLADLGAQVIKVESPARPDILRGPLHPHSAAEGCYPEDEPGARPFDRHGYYNDRNLGKLGLAVDSGRPEGMAVIRGLVAVSDVIIENYAVGVMGRLGLGYRKLRAVNPRIIYLSMPANGNSGPEAGYNGFGITNDLMSGMSRATGYPDGPQNLGINASDPVAGLHGAGAVLVALWARRATGHGAFIDLSQRESAIRVCFQQIVDFQMNGREPELRGNKHREMAPHGYYPCRGDDRWIALAVPDGASWRALCEAMGRPDLRDDPRLHTSAGRQQHEDLVDAGISSWTRAADNRQLMVMLQERGIPAAAVASVSDLMEDPHLLWRGFFHDVDHPLAGRRRHLGAGFHLHPPGLTPPRGPAPCFGQHNELILTRILGYPPETVRRLQEAGVISDAPRERSSGQDKGAPARSPSARNKVRKEGKTR